MSMQGQGDLTLQFRIIRTKIIIFNIQLCSFSPSPTLAVEKFYWLSTPTNFGSFHMHNVILTDQISMCTHELLIIPIFF